MSAVKFKMPPVTIPEGPKFLLGKSVEADSSFFIRQKSQRTSTDPEGIALSRTIFFNLMIVEIQDSILHLYLSDSLSDEEAVRMVFLSISPC